MILCLEGIDACGKTSQVDAVEVYIKKDRYSPFKTVATFKFPNYESETGRIIKDILQGSLTDYPDKSYLLQSMQIMNRLEMSWLLRAAKSSPDTLLILDRCTMSGIAYGAVDGILHDHAELTALYMSEVQQSLVQPDITVLIDIPGSESFLRRPSRHDQYEADERRLELTSAMYRSAFAIEHDRSSCDASGTATDDFFIVDGLRTKKVITLSLIDILERRVQDDTRYPLTYTITPNIP